VLLSSHVLAEVEALCDRISIIRDGRIAESGSLTELRHLTRTHVAVETAAPLPALGEVPGVHELTIEGTTARFEVDPQHLDDLLAVLARADVRSLTCTPPTLEELFLRHYDVRAEGADEPAAAATGGAS